MSDFTPDEAAYIGENQLRATRFAKVAQAVAVETDMRDNRTIQLLTAAVRNDADQAMEDLAETSPSDQAAVSLLLVKVRTLVYIRRTLNVILREGKSAEEAIRAEDYREHGE